MCDGGKGTVVGLNVKVDKRVDRSMRIVTADKMHVYGVQNIVTGEVKDVHEVRLRFDADKDLEMTVAVKEVFQHAFTQGEFEMAEIVDISEAEEEQDFDVKMDWVEFDEGENSWEALAVIWGGAP